MTTHCNVLLHDIRNMDDVYDQLGRQLPLPAHFGRNLDALFDFLTVDAAGPLTLNWPDAADARTHLGTERHAALLATLRDAADERSDLQLRIG
ncbi:barstar family protein [Jeongeupia naejangsanensis]|uniref:Barstar family protein n=1 Tax=Jeongeupia naejangsanensis TaxID=613195 RepID=A0ABS2BJ15_9NEIS|nr:barstar family protein [Jeongeupia naejangsanensis]MBM3115586.1 barstar family protein [Jeongeupia naejangsanensis]